MADWKQITARIRRARTGKDPAGQLTNLFSKTRDAMVAFELARYFESTGNNADAGRWYLTAAERFRRADWKTKAQESATRLGATEPAEIPAPVSKSESASSADSPEESAPAEAPSEESSEREREPEPAEAAAPESRPTESRSAESSRSSSGRSRGRGRRGGRDRRGSHSRSSEESSSRHSAPPPPPSAPETEELPTRSFESRAAEPSSPSLRGRSGDPGLASRLTQLEMNFRRLLSSAPVKLEQAASAPAGPGVWVLTDEDLSTYYYVEPCQTLRVAIGQVLRGGARHGQPIKPQLAEHLGIPESRVSKYLTDHCVVRWLQMDEGASHFAHFLIAVLHPSLNE